MDIARSVRGSTVLIATILMVLTSVSGDVKAQSSPLVPGPESDSYATYYGDGLRHYTEGRYDQAVESLFRAYALRPTASVARLLVRSYDFMGHCDAAQRQIEFFREVHPRTETPQFQRCKEPAQLKITCEPLGAEVKVNRMIDTYCGATLSVAGGMQHLWLAREPAIQQQVAVAAGELVEVHLESPEKRTREWSVVDSNVRVPRLTRPTAAYQMIRSSDGLYRIWVREEMGNDPDMLPLDTLRFRPYVEIICADEERESEGDPSCYFLKRLQQKRPGYSEDSTRFEGLVPRVP